MEETYFDKERARLQAWLNSPEYQKKLEERIKIQDACQRSREAQILTFGLCQEDPVFFINNFGWTFDPRPEHEPNHFPFILFDFQKDLIYWLKDHVENGKDGLIEKSRDMGITWCFVWFAYWLWRFKPNSSGLLGSYKEALVDDRTRNSLFGMLDYSLQNTPKWLMPQRFKMKDHRQKLKLINPENGNLISGDSMNPDFSRGSRRGYVFLDEGASWEYFREAWESAGDVTSCRLTCSTPKGKNAFSILRDSGIDYITLHWRKHPFKDEAWYEFQKQRRTDEEIAQEIDISYHRSQTGRVYPEWDNVEYGLYPYEERLPLYCSWDFGFCLSGDTEALTPNGWKHYSQINKGDLIYTLNQDTKMGEWQPMKDKTVLNGEFDAYSLSGKGINTIFTKNHHWFVLRDVGRKKHSIIGNLKTIKETKTTERIPCGAELVSFPLKPIYSDSFIELMAWFWTEGYINSGAIEIGQAVLKNIPIIRNSLYREFGKSKESLLGIKYPAWTERKPVLRKNSKLPITRFYINRQGAERFLELSNENKVISYDFINSLTKKQLELFIKISMMADGCLNSLSLKQANKQRTEVFAYANILLGKKLSYQTEIVGNGYDDEYKVKIFKKGAFIYLYNFLWRRNALKDIKYKGKVWCPTIDNHVWLARSKGTVYFTGNTDECALIWFQTPPGEKIRLVDAYSNHGKTIDWYVPFVTGVVPGMDYHYSKKDLEVIESHKNWKRATHFGDPAGRSRNQVADKSVLDVLKNLGIYVNVYEEAKEFEKRRNATKLLLRDLVVNDNERTKELGAAIENSHYPQIVRGGMENVRTIKPVHDFSSHFRSSLEYFAVGIQKMIGRRFEVKDKFPPRERKRIIAY